MDRVMVKQGLDWNKIQDKRVKEVNVLIKKRKGADSVLTATSKNRAHSRLRRKYPLRLRAYRVILGKNRYGCRIQVFLGG